MVETARNVLGWTVNPLDRFTLSGDYGSGVDLQCDECPRFISSLAVYISLTEVIKIAEKHNKENHGKDVE